MQATMSGCSSIGRLALVLFLAAGLTATGAQQATPRNPGSTGGNGSPTASPESPGNTGSTDGNGSPTASPESPGKPVDGSGTTTRQNSGSASAAPQLQFGIWLVNSAEGRRYQAVESRIQELSDYASRAGVPLEVFMIRMKEAMTKNVAPAVFIAALEMDTAHWLRVAVLLRDADWPPASKAPDFYIAASNALRNGVEEATIRILVNWALASRGTPERAGAVLMSVSSLTTLMDTTELTATAGIMAASRLRVGEFDDLAALLQRAASAGRTRSELLAALEAVLGKRGTLRSLERRLFP